MEQKTSYLWKNTKENTKMARKNSINTLALNSNKAACCWRNDWRMTDCHPASLLCLSTGWQGVVLHEHHSHSESPEVTAGMTGLEGSVNSQRLFVFKAESHHPTQQLWPPVCMRMLMTTTRVCERSSSVMSVDPPEHPEPWEQRGFCTSAW